MATNADRGYATLSQEEMQGMEHRLTGVLFSLKSIHMLSNELLACNDEAREAFCIAVGEMARANIKGVDACLGKLIGKDFAQGNFATEFQDY